MELQDLQFSSKEELDAYKTEHKLIKEHSKPNATNPIGYDSLSLSCECHGTYKSRGEGLRNAKPSIKFDCPFIIHLVLNDDRTKLIVDHEGIERKFKKKVKTSVFVHNERCIQFHQEKRGNIIF